MRTLPSPMYSNNDTFTLRSISEGSEMVRALLEEASLRVCL